jgi:hypothetical protein
MSGLRGRWSVTQRVLAGWLFCALLVMGAVWPPTRLVSAGLGALALLVAALLAIRANWRQDRTFVLLMGPVFALNGALVALSIVGSGRPWETAQLVLGSSGAAAVAARPMLLAVEADAYALGSTAERRDFWYQWSTGPYWCIVWNCEAEVDGRDEMLCDVHVVHPHWLRHGAPPHCAVMSCREPSTGNGSLCWHTSTAVIPSRQRCIPATPLP